MGPEIGKGPNFLFPKEGPKREGL